MQVVSTITHFVEYTIKNLDARNNEFLFAAVL